MNHANTFRYERQAGSTLLHVWFPKPLVDNFKQTFSEGFWNTQMGCWLLPVWWLESLEDWMGKQSRALAAREALRSRWTNRAAAVWMACAVTPGCIAPVTDTRAESKPPDVKLISDYPYSNACAVRADQLRKQGEGLHIACDCDPTATMCWAFNNDGDIVAWKHSDKITVAAKGE